MADRRYHALLALNLVAAAHCMVAQIALSVTLSFVAGRSVSVFALFIGIYLAAMGVGVIVVERLEATTSRWLGRLLLLTTVAALAASPGVPLIMLAHEKLGRGTGALMVWLSGAALCLILGGVAGAFLPIISKVAEAERWPAARRLIGVLTSDYAGAFVGTIVFALVLYPHLGLVRAVVLSQMVAIVAVNLTVVALGLARQRPRLVLPVLLLLDGALVAAFPFQDRFVAFLDRMPM